MNTSTQRVGLIGDPVTHSRSPAMQNSAFHHLGIAATYELWPTPAAELPARITLLREAAVLGANVTLPHKTAIMPLLDAIEPAAQRIGAINTIFKRSGAELVGANTDAPALIEALRDEGQFDPAGQAVVLLGASGAARAAAFALIDAGVRQLVVANRTPERAEELLGDILVDVYGEDEEGEEVMANNGHAPGGLEEAGDPADLQLFALALDDPDLSDYIKDSALLINATSLGWHADETPLPDPPVGPNLLVYDMVYRPTRLLHDAAARGASTLDGLGMLVRQGALAFSYWTGRAAPLEVMRKALHTM